MMSHCVHFQIIIACIWIVALALAIPQAVAFRTVIVDINGIDTLQCLPSSNQTEGPEPWFHM